MKVTMNMNVGVRTLLVLALVLAATCAIIMPELFGGTAQPHSTAAFNLVALPHQ